MGTEILLVQNELKSIYLGWGIKNTGDANFTLAKVLFFDENLLGVK